jgi:hypothetical protein
MASRETICARLEAALEKMRAQQMDVRAIYLTKADRDELDAINTRAFGVKGAKVHSCSFGGHIVRAGKHSVIYSVHGVGTTVPRRLSAKVAG